MATRVCRSLSFMNRRALAMLAGSIVAIASAEARGAPEMAAWSDAVVASTGVNTHFDYGNTPYVTAYAQVKAALLASGLRVIRSAVLGDPATLNGKFVPQDKMADLAAAGVHIDFLCDLNSTTPATCVALVKAFDALYPGAVTSVEGPNEPDGFWAQLYPAGYKGQGYPAGPAQWQKDMYAAFKADAATASIPVYGIALGLAGQPPCSNANPLGDAGELSAYVDFGNFHPYPSGNPWHPDFPYDFIDSYYHQSLLPSALLDPTPAPGLTGFDDDVCQDSKPYGKKPMVATETGVETKTGGIPEAHLAALVPRIVLENYRLGIAHSLLYELLDSGGQTFGLLRADVSARPSYTAVAALLTRLADPGPAFAPASLDYDLSLSPVTLKQGDPKQTFDKLSYVHHLLLQKRDGRFELVVWHEIATDQTYPTYASVAPPPIPGTLSVHSPFASGSLTTVDATGTPAKTPVDVTKPIALPITERFAIVELVPTASADAGIEAGDDDAGITDAAGSLPDAGAVGDIEGPSSGDAPAGSGGCGCVAAGQTAAAGEIAAVALVVAASLSLARRRRRRRH